LILLNRHTDSAQVGLGHWRQRFDARGTTLRMNPRAIEDAACLAPVNDQILACKQTVVVSDQIVTDKDG
jgi:hypothetical protein